MAGLEKREDSKRSHHDRERHRDRDHHHRASYEKDREREKNSVDDKYKEREKHHRDNDKDKKKEKERVKREREGREREREKERDRKKERERERRECEREKDKKRESIRKRDNSDGDDVSNRDRKRRRREDDHKDKERECERSSKSSSRKRDGSVDNSPRKRDVNDFLDKNEKRSPEDDIGEEQRKLDEDIEKRRRRVQEWQELKRKTEESERGNLGVDTDVDEPKFAKTWTLEGDTDDEKDMNGVEDAKPTNNGDDMEIESKNGGHIVVDDEEIDPLDAFMNAMVLPEVEKLNGAAVQVADKSIGRIIPGDDSDSDYGDGDNGDDPLEEDEDALMRSVKRTKVEKLSIVDHSKIDYPSFRKNFYIEVKEIVRMTSEEAAAYRRQLELEIHGKDVPKPIKTWPQTGLSTKVLDELKKLNFESPMSIQAQALPIIMNGRDCIGIAKTGSGKTLAFVLPMLRHIKDQPPLMPGDGPTGLIMAPTRELVWQIHNDIKKFAKVVGIRCLPVYGGSGVAQQISELKQGAEIVVCTPGRMIDILCTSSGKITNLRRVTYLVMDEADRMFDMGFEPQITRIVQNTRPDRQTVLFSATFPAKVEGLARNILNKPVQIQVGGRSVVNKDISQLVEVRPENDKFLRVLELLGEWDNKGKILIFVNSQEKCDTLFKDFLKHGYPCLSLHGAKDQTDRESTISDFKSNVCNLLIATSIIARGLDVKDLELVINFDVPNHYEDYVHRVGRTGRAGRKGCAITFISEDDARYAPDLVKALELSDQIVPQDLKALADGFMAKLNQGLERAHGTGYGGSGFKFNEEEEEVRKAAKKAQAKEYGFEEVKSDSEDEDEDNQLCTNGESPTSLPVAPTTILSDVISEGAARAKMLLEKLQANALPKKSEAELEINDYPQYSRWKVTHRETLGEISELYGAAITIRGQYVPPGKNPGPGVRKLFLLIEGSSEQTVKMAKAELLRKLKEIIAQASSLPGSAQPGRY